MHTSVLKWPDRETVDAAAPAWTARQAARRPQLRRLGYFGSCATGDWGVGSDLDLVAVVATSDRPFFERGRDWHLNALPVASEILVCTEPEWRDTVAHGDRSAAAMSTQIVWMIG